MPWSDLAKRRAYAARPENKARRAELDSEAYADAAKKAKKRAYDAVWRAIPTNKAKKAARDASYRTHNAIARKIILNACPRCGILMTLGECRFCILELTGVQLVGALR